MAVILTRKEHWNVKLGALQLLIVTKKLVLERCFRKRQPPECSDSPWCLMKPKACFPFAKLIATERWLGRDGGECAQFNYVCPHKENVHMNTCPFWMIPQYVNTCPKLYNKMYKPHKHYYQLLLWGRGEAEEDLICVRTWLNQLVAFVDNVCKNSA